MNLGAGYETLLITEPEPGVVQVTLNRPERLNAMTAVMFTELERVSRAWGWSTGSVSPVRC